MERNLGFLNTINNIDMKQTFLGIFVLITLNNCNFNNNNESNIIENNILREEKKYDNDKILSEQVHYQKINDDYYRIIIPNESLPTMPFNYELTQSNILKNIKIPFDKIEIIKYENAINNDSIFTYYFGNSYIKVYKNEDGKCSPLEFVIKDKEVILSNGLEIGKDRDLFNSIYSKAAEFKMINCIGICDESEFSEVYFHFENNIINKIVFINH